MILDRCRRPSWQRPPGVEERQRYRDRIEWHWYSRYLPREWHLSGTDIPKESWWEWRDQHIHVDRLENPEAKVVVILLHGGGGYGRLLMVFGPMLRRLGAEVVAPDLPGYGLTVRRGGHSPTYTQWAEIAADLAEHERKTRGLPVILFGLSLGGFLAYAAATRAPNVSGVMATTLLDTRERAGFLQIARSRALAALSVPLLRILPPAAQGIAIPIRWVAPMELITNDPDFSAVFARDSLGGGARITLGFLRSLHAVTLPTEPEEFNTCPVLVMHPTLDPWTPPAASRRFFDRLSGAKEWVDLEGCGHLPCESPGREDLARAVQRFIRRVAG
ncbi:MAG: alpha/beta hydrolase [Spirochaetota bacterium]